MFVCIFLYIYVSFFLYKSITKTAFPLGKKIMCGKRKESYKIFRYLTYSRQFVKNATNLPYKFSDELPPKKGINRKRWLKLSNVVEMLQTFFRKSSTPKMTQVWLSLRFTNVPNATKVQHWIQDCWKKKKKKSNRRSVNKRISM